MAGAFPPDAFQSDPAFQTAADTPVTTPRPTGGGGGGGSGAWVNLPRFRGRRVNTRLPSLPRMAMPPKVKPPTDRRLENEQDRLTERWQLWQQSVQGKGTASILEFICYEYLTKVKNQVEGVDFYYQWSVAGGRTRFGGFVADFYIPAKHLVWNPAGLQFHYTKPRDRAHDALSKVVLASRGITEVFLWEDDLLSRPRYTLDHAWNGEQVGWRFAAN